MQNKMLMLLFFFQVSFSLHGFSQANEKSTHPLMDKYYPPKKSADTNTILPNQSKLAPETPVVTETKPIQVPTDTAVIISPVNTVQSETKVMPLEKPVTATSDSIVINKPTNSIPEPVKEKTEAKPDAAPYRPTRLGSSSRLYKTWETNNDGAGSVTTGSKN
jgi:hypothetical protein